MSTEIKKQRTTVALRIYKGKEILLKADGVTPANENQLVKLTYGDLQWKSHLQNLLKGGLCKIEVEAVYLGEDKIQTPAVIENEIKALLQVKEAELTEDQKRMKALEESNAKLQEQLEALLNQGNAGQPANDIDVNAAEQLDGVKEAEFKVKETALLDLGFERIEDDFVKGDISISAEDVYEISEEDLIKIASPEPKTETKESNENELKLAREKYVAKFGKAVPNNKLNNLAWILTELEK